MYFGNIWNTVVTCMLVLQFCNIELHRHSHGSQCDISKECYIY